MSILMVTGIEGARNCAAVVGAQLGMEVEVAEGRRAALAALRRREFLALVIDESLAECDPAAAEKICDKRRPGHSHANQLCRLGSGAADPRDPRGAQPSRPRADAGPPGRHAAIETELKTTVAGLLLHSQLALSGSGVPAAVADRLRTVADLAGSLRQQLSVPSETRRETHA